MFERSMETSARVDQCTFSCPWPSKLTTYKNPLERCQLVYAQITNLQGVETIFPWNPAGLQTQTLGSHDANMFTLMYDNGTLSNEMFCIVIQRFSNPGCRGQPKSRVVADVAWRQAGTHHSEFGRQKQKLQNAKSGCGATDLRQILIRMAPPIWFGIDPPFFWSRLETNLFLGLNSNRNCNRSAVEFFALNVFWAMHPLSQRLAPPCLAFVWRAILGSGYVLHLTRPFVLSLDRLQRLVPAAGRLGIPFAVPGKQSFGFPKNGLDEKAVDDLRSHPQPHPIHKNYVAL